MNKKLALGALAVLSLFVIFYFVSQPASHEMTVGYLPVLVNLPLFVALEQDYFEQHGITVEAIEAQSPNHIVEGIISGRLDGAGILAYPILFAAEEKYPGELTLFASTDETSTEYVAALIVRNDSGIKDIADLEGKRVGVYTGLVQVLFLKGILTGMGVDPETYVEIVQISPRLQLQGLEAGQYDALSTVEPFVTIAKSKNIGEVLISNPRVTYIQDPFPSVATPLSAEFLQEQPETSRKYLLAYRDAVDFIREHPAEAKQYLAKYTPIQEDTAQEVRLPRFNQYGEEDRQNVQKYADWMLENGLLENRVNVTSMFGTLALE